MATEVVVAGSAQEETLGPNGLVKVIASCVDM